MTLRDKVQALEDQMKAMPQAPYGEFHHFDHGVYQRGMVIPAGTVATGAVHLFESMLTLVKGECLFIGDGEPVHAAAPFAAINAPGTKRGVYAITDCVLIGYVVTDLTDPDEIRELVTVDTVDQYTLLQGTSYGVRSINGGGGSGTSPGGSVCP